MLEWFGSFVQLIREDRSNGGCSFRICRGRSAATLGVDSHSVSNQKWELRAQPGRQMRCSPNEHRARHPSGRLCTHAQGVNGGTPLAHIVHGMRAFRASGKSRQINVRIPPNKTLHTLYHCQCCWCFLS